MTTKFTSRNFLCSFLCASFAVCLVATSSLFAQAPSIEWQKCLGGTSPDAASAIFQTSDGGFIVAGTTESHDGDMQGIHYTGDIVIMKLDSRGTLQWQKFFGGSGIDVISSMIKTRDGGFAFAGYTNSNDGDVLGNHGDIDGWVVKLDSSFNMQWQHCLGGKKADFLNSITELSDGGFVVAGKTFSDEEGLFNTTFDNGREDVFVARLTAEGSLRWQECYGGGGSETAYSVIQSSDGGFVVVGETDSHDDGDIFGNHGGLFGGGDGWIFKLNTSGKLIWQKCLGGSYWDLISRVIQISDGSYVLEGMTSSANGDVVGQHRKGTFDVWIVDLDTSRNIIWQKCLGGWNDDGSGGFIQTADSGFLVAGRTLSDDGDVSGFHFGSDSVADDWIVKLSAQGNILWQKCIGGTGRDGGSLIDNGVFYGPSPIQTADGFYAIAGSTTSHDGDVAGIHDTSKSGSDMWIVKFGPPQSGSVETPFTDQHGLMKLFPNPASDGVQLQLPANSQITSVAFYDLLGRVQYPSYSLQSNSAKVDVRDLLPGTYIARVTCLQSGSSSSFALPFVVRH